MPEPRSQDTVTTFLERQGYLQPPSASGGAGFTGESQLAEGLAEYQRRHRLPVTGTADEATLLHMQLRRCAWVDREDFHRDEMRLRALSPDRGPVRWSLEELPAGLNLDPVLVAHIAQQAFSLWMTVAPVQFIQSATLEQVSVGWRAGPHEDGIDMAGVVLAHASALRPIHLDLEETWCIDDPAAGNAHLLTVLLHEIGHVLGLGDVSGDPTAVMFGFFGVGTPATVRTAFSATDLALIESVLGPS